MKNKKKIYRNENWGYISGDINNHKCFRDDRFEISFNAFTNELWCQKGDPFETLPVIDILPEAEETLLDDFRDETGMVRIILN